MASETTTETNDPRRPPGSQLHEMDIEVKWGDMDAMGHVNNAVYFTYFEHIRLTWYEQSGCGVLGSTTEGFVIVNNHAEYLKPVVWPAVIKVRLGGHSPGRSSFMSTYTVCINDELYTAGYAKVVWIDTKKQASIPLPSFVREQLA